MNEAYAVVASPKGALDYMVRTLESGGHLAKASVRVEFRQGQFWTLIPGRTQGDVIDFESPLLPPAEVVMRDGMRMERVSDRLRRVWARCLGRLMRENLMDALVEDVLAAPSGRQSPPRLAIGGDMYLFVRADSSEDAIFEAIQTPPSYQGIILLMRSRDSPAVGGVGVNWPPAPLPELVQGILASAFDGEGFLGWSRFPAPASVPSLPCLGPDPPTTLPDLASRL